MRGGGGQGEFAFEFFGFLFVFVECKKWFLKQIKLNVISKIIIWLSIDYLGTRKII